MSKYCIWIISPPGDARSGAYNEFAEGLHYALASLGHASPIIRSQQDIDGIPIILGCNLIREMVDIKIPSNSILFNLEQVYKKSPWFTEDYIELLKNYKVWDYCGLNITRLKKNFNINSVQHCPVGYVPQLTRLDNVKDKDIDILMYGKASPKRMWIMESLKKFNLKVEFLNSVYGRTRDDYIERSKIILNVHCYEAKIFEIIRVSYLLANKKLVISEVGLDKALEEPLKGGVVFSKYEDIIDRCLYYLDSKRGKEGEKISNKGFSLFSSKLQSEYLKEIL